MSFEQFAHRSCRTTSSSVSLYLFGTERINNLFFLSLFLLCWKSEKKIIFSSSLLHQKGKAENLDFMLCVLLGRSATRETKSICPRVKAEKTLCIWLWAGRGWHFRGCGEEISSIPISRYYQDQIRCQKLCWMFVDTDSSDESNIYSIAGRVCDEVHWTELTTACWACLTSLDRLRY